MSASGAEIPSGDGCVARLDDDPAHAWCDQAGGGAHTRPHAALHGAGLDVAFRPRCRETGTAGLAEDLLFQAGLTCPAGVTDATGSGCDVVVCHGGYLGGVGTLARWAQGPKRQDGVNSRIEMAQQFGAVTSRSFWDVLDLPDIAGSDAKQAALFYPVVQKTALKHPGSAFVCWLIMRLK